MVGALSYEYMKGSNLSSVSARSIQYRLHLHLPAACESSVQFIDSYILFYRIISQVFPKMKAYNLCLLALAAVSSARPRPSEGGGGGPGQGQRQGYHPSKWQNQEYYKKAKHTPSVNGGNHGGGGHAGSPATTAFPTLGSVIGGYGGAGTAGYAGAGTGGYQPPAPTSSAVRKTSYQDSSEYSEDSEKKSGESNSGNSGSQSLGSGPSGVAGSGPVSTGVSTTGNLTTGGTISNGKITLPANCQSVNGIGFGWLPDYNGASLAVDENAVGNNNPCFAGYYGQTGLSVWNNGAQVSLAARIRSV